MMDTAHRDLLVRWRAQLVDEIDILHGLLSHLKSRKVLSARMAQDLTYNMPPHRQIEELLDLLPWRGEDAFRHFCDSLVESGQEAIVRAYLQDEDCHSMEFTSFDCSAHALLVSSSFIKIPACAVSPNSAESSDSASSPAAAAVQHTPPSVSVPTSVCFSIDHESSQRPSAGAFYSPSKRPYFDRERMREDTLVAPVCSELGFSIPPSTAVKENLLDGTSVICIKGSSDVIKICRKYPSHFAETSARNDAHADPLTCGPLAHDICLGGGEESGVVVGRGNVTEERRYTLKHFLPAKDDYGLETGVGHNVPLLSGLHQRYLDLFSSRQGAVMEKVMPWACDISREMMTDTLSRCDTTDTMEVGKHVPGMTKPAIGSQVDQSSVKISPILVTNTPHLAADTAPRMLGNVKRFSDVASSAGVPRDVSFSPTESERVLITPVTERRFSSCSLHVRVEKSSPRFFEMNKGKSYRMSSIPRGQALLINVNAVEGKPPRRGTDIDRDNLFKLLTQLYFKVTVYNDEDGLTAQGLVNKLYDFVRLPQHANADACVICLLSHGEEGFLFGTDGKKIPLEEIFSLFDNRHCPALLGKPKVFFVQACRGGLLDQGVQVLHDETDGGAVFVADNAVQHPSMSDMVICYPTLQGYYAWRNREKGSWYVESLVKVFMKHAKDEDICAMLNRVNWVVSRKVSRTPTLEMDRMSQMSEYKCSLRWPYLFFYPGISLSAVTV